MVSPISGHILLTYLSRGKSASLEGQLGVGADRGQLLRDVQGDLLVARGGAGGGVLVLGDGGDLGVLGGLVAEDRGLPDGGGVPLERPEQDGVGLAGDVARRLGVGEGLVGDDLLEAVEVLDLGRARGGGGVAQEGEDGVRDAHGVVELEVRVGDVEDRLVRVLLGHLSLDDGAVDGQIAGGGETGEGEESRSVLHLCGSSEREGM